MLCCVLPAACLLPVSERMRDFFLRKQNIDIAISQSSFHSPLTAWLLKIPSIYMNDNEHAVGNIPSFIFANQILLPEFFSTLIHI